MSNRVIFGNSIASLLNTWYFSKLLLIEVKSDVSPKAN